SEIFNQPALNSGNKITALTARKNLAFDAALIQAYYAWLNVLNNARKVESDCREIEKTEPCNRLYGVAKFMWLPVTVDALSAIGTVWSIYRSDIRTYAGNKRAKAVFGNRTIKVYPTDTVINAATGEPIGIPKIVGENTEWIRPNALIETAKKVGFLSRIN